MMKFKRAGLMVLQVLTALATVAATVIMFLHPACVGYMLDEVARGVSAGVLLAGVKMLVAVNRPETVCKPILCFCRFGWAVTWHELKNALIAGYLLGLIEATWSCGNG